VGGNLYKPFHLGETQLHNAFKNLGKGLKIINSLFVLEKYIPFSKFLGNFIDLLRIFGIFCIFFLILYTCFCPLKNTYH